MSLTISIATDEYPEEVGIIFSHLDTGREYWFIGYDSDPVVSDDGLSMFERRFINLPAGVYSLGLFDQSRDGLWYVPFLYDLFS